MVALELLLTVEPKVRSNETAAANMLPMANELRLATEQLRRLLPPFVAVHHIGPGDAWSELVEGEEGLIRPRTVESRRADIARGRTAARRALADVGGPETPILRGEHGEPFWPDGFLGSITHTNDHAVAVASTTGACRALGVDLEHRDRFFPDLERYAVVDAERRWLAALPDAQRSASTMELFSAKESIYKALFPSVGRFFGFEAVALTPTPGGGYTAEMVDDSEDFFATPRHFDVGVVWLGGFVFTWVVLTD